MASVNINIARWSALVLGAGYGFYHQRTIYRRDRQEAVERAYQEQESVLARARAEWTKKTAPPQSLTPSGGVISDPNDPKFDLEAYLNMAEANAKTK